MARRTYGAGAVYRRASDGRWIGTIEAGWTRTGARRRISVTASTEVEAKARLRDKREQIAREGSAAGRRRTTVKAWAGEWLSIVERSRRPKTHANHATAVRRWIIPTIGAIALDALTPRDVRKVGDAQRAAGLSSSSRLRTHAVLIRMLRDAQADGHTVPPRVLAVKGPPTGVSDRTSIPVPDALRMLDVAAELPHFSRWVAALMLGMRKAECLGLTWDCVDLDAGRIHISWQLQALPYLDRAADTFSIPDGYETRRLHHAQHLVRPKSSKGWRAIPIGPTFLPEALREWRLVAPQSPHGLVWPRAADGQPASEKHDLAEWKALQDTVGVRHPSGRHYVLHEARNTTATLLMEARVPSVVITEILGHADIVTSQGYMHVGIEPASAAIAAVAGRLRLEG